MIRYYKAVCMAIVGVIAGVGVLAGGTLAVGEGSPGVPVTLTVDQNLSCQSVTLGFAEGAAIRAENVTINESRFPWKNQWVMVSVNEEAHELVFTVADLVGQNVMVRAGEGVLFTIDADAELSFKSGLAYNSNSEPVEITAKGL